MENTHTHTHIKQENQDDQAAHISFTGPFKDHTMKLHTKTQSSISP